ncbi:hypothetical protein ACEWY4_017601 [Coilia grayii]|uniref:Neuronal-specific septin-3 n=1 Tax=Coilia grayii TaxID=363190 RepID=A0ABD1JHB4_9TELE
MTSNKPASGKTPLPQIAPSSPKITLTRSTSLLGVAGAGAAPPSSPLVRRRPIHILSSPPAGLLPVPQATRSQPSSPTTPRSLLPVKSSPPAVQSDPRDKDQPSAVSNQLERISPSLEVWSEKWPAEGQSLRLSPTPSSERKARSISISNPERCSVANDGDETADSATLNHDAAGGKPDSAPAVPSHNNSNIKAPSAASWSKERKRPSSTGEVVKGSRPSGQIKRKYQDPVLLQARLRLTKTGRGAESSPRLLGRGQEGREVQATKRPQRDNTSVTVERDLQTTLLALTSPTGESTTSLPSVRSTRTHSISAMCPRALGSTAASAHANRHTLRQPKAVPVSPTTECRNNRGDHGSNSDQLRETSSLGYPWHTECTFICIFFLFHSCLPCRLPPIACDRTRLQRGGSETDPRRQGITAPSGCPPTAAPRLESFPLKSDRSTEEAGGQLGRFSPLARQIKEGDMGADSRPTCQAPIQPYETPGPLATQSPNHAERQEGQGISHSHQNTPTCSNTESSLCHTGDRTVRHSVKEGRPFSQPPNHCAAACDVFSENTNVVKSRADSLPPLPDPSHITTRGEGLPPDQRGGRGGHVVGDAPECAVDEWRDQQLMSPGCQHCQHQQYHQHNHPHQHSIHHLQDQVHLPRPRLRNRPHQAARQSAQLVGSDGPRHTDVDLCPLSTPDPPLPRPSVPLEMSALQGPGLESGVWVTLGRNLRIFKIEFCDSTSAIDMTDVVPPEVRPKPAVPAKPPHVAPPAVPSHPAPLSSGASVRMSGGSALLGYIGIDTIIEQMRKKTMKTGFDFNMMVVGQSGLGKSTLVNTLFKSQVSRRNSDRGRDEKIPKTVEIKSVSHVIEEGGVKMKLTITDTPGFGDQINNDNCWEPISKFINEQYEKYLKEEVNIARNKRIPDTRVHCCLYFIAPTGHSLRPLDIEFMKHLSRSVNLIPVIAKSDTLTPEEKSEFKQRVRKELEVCGIEFYPQKEFDDDIEDKSDNDKIREVMPFAVVGSDKEYQVNGKRVLGRKTAWGIVEVENLTHCEFSLLRDFIIRSHLQDLKEVTHNIHYETYRARRLNANGGLHPISTAADTQESNL